MMIRTWKPLAVILTAAKLLTLLKFSSSEVLWSFQVAPLLAESSPGTAYTWSGSDGQIIVRGATDSGDTSEASFNVMGVIFSFT